jgi:hypothetical protein
VPGYSDIAQLDYLLDIEDVQFELHGGVAYRFALRAGLGTEVEEQIDLFDLTPFTADIDLLHSGPATPRILQQILAQVPNADCFRWEVRSHAQQQTLLEFAPKSAIPARALRLTRDEINDPYGGLQDIRTRRFRFIRDLSYRQSPLFLGGRYLEVFLALLYLQTLFEAGLTPEELSQQPGREDVGHIFFDATNTETQILLREHTYLRTRLSHLLTNCISSAPADIFWYTAELYGLRHFIGWVAETEGLVTPELAAYLREFYSERRDGRHMVLSPSSPLRGGSHRLPFATELWVDQSSAALRFEKTGVALPSRHVVLMASGEVPLSPGRAPKPYYEGAPPLDELLGPISGAIYPQEFIYFALPHEYHDSLMNFGDANLSVLTAVRSWWWRFLPTPRWTIFSLPAVVHRPHAEPVATSRRLYIRANSLGLFETLARFSGAKVQFFLVGLRSDSE